MLHTCTCRWGPGAIQRKAAQGVAAAGKERLAQGYKAVGKGLRQTDANAVRPDDIVKDGAVVGLLRGQPCEIDAGAQLARIEVEFDRLQGAFVRIQRIVAGIVGEIGRDGGEPNMLILGRHQLGNQNAGQISLTEAVTQKKTSCLFLVQKSLQLIAAVFNLRRIDRIFFVFFDQNGGGRSPF